MDGRRSNLIDQAQTAGWPTARASDGPKGVCRQNRVGTTGQDLPTIAGWATPTSTELSNTLDSYVAMKANMASGPRTAITALSQQAMTTGWATPTGSDCKDAGPAVETSRELQDALIEKAHLGGQAHSTGPTSPGSPAASPEATPRSSGQLNPELPCWLMGYPVEWLFAAPYSKAIPRFKKNTGTRAPEPSKDSETPSSPSSPPCS